MPNYSASVKLENVDWTELRDQKIELLRTIGPMHDCEQKAALQGILHFLDHVQNQAAEVLGEKIVFPPQLEVLISRGAIYPISLPEGMDMIVRDYDIQDDGEDFDIRKDEVGNSYQHIELSED